MPDRTSVARRLPLVLLLAVAIALFYASGAQQYLSLAGLQSVLAPLREWQAASPLAAAALFFTVYVAMTALSLPGAGVLSLAGGAIFGLAQGLPLVWLAAGTGALLAFLVSRYLARDLVQSRFGEQLRAIDAGIAREGAAYLLTLRLVPLFPFFLINLLFGLTAMPARTFWLVSQVGMLPGSVVYVNAGRELGGLQSLSGIVSPGVLGSLALLGIFPLIASRAVRAWQRRRVYARFRRPRRFDRNLVVIGAGAAGLVSAYIAATVRARVTLVEADRMGGDCLNTGCVPSKALIHAARLAHAVRGAARAGISTTAPAVDFPRVMSRVRDVISRIEPHDSVERYTALGVDVVSGHARLLDPWTVEVQDSAGGTQRLTTRSIVIATGAEPAVPAIPGIGESGFLTSETLWDALSAMDAAPARVVVLGGGPIGVELAQALARLGSAVVLVESLPRLLSREDAEAAGLVTASLRADGVEVLTGTTALRCAQQGSERFLEVGPAESPRRLAYDLLLCATGRKARLTGYGLEELGIPATRTLDTNEYLETLYPNILAAGDVAGPFQLTHAAAHQAWYAAVNALFGQFRRFAADYRVIPRVTFCAPEVASVGISEDAARASGIAFDITRYGLDDLDRAIADDVAEGFVKVITAPGTDRILGVTIVGEQAGELIATFVFAMRWKLGLGKILSTLHAYPTLAESARFTAGEWRRARAPQRLLGWVERYHAWRRG